MPVRAVLKFGGEVVADREALTRVLAEIRGLLDEGWRFLIVHGGGPQAGALQERLGLQPHKVAGRRVTDDATLSVMKQAVAGEVNIDLVAHALGVGIDAIGLSGVGGRLVEATRRPVVPVAEAGGEVVDYGHVGEVRRVRTDLIETLWAAGLTPVLNPLGVDHGRDGTPAIYNINADTVASCAAAALRVDHLFLVTSTPGVLRDRDDPTTRIPRLTASEARAAVDDGTIGGGMIPKVLDALERLEQGIGAIHILAASPGALSEEAHEPGRRGTVLLKPTETRDPLREPSSR
jgi:acetylglutamate kinase